MSKPRRADYEPIEVTIEQADPRHGGRRAALLKRGIAPAAIVGLLATATTLTFVPLGSGSTSVADPLHQPSTGLDASRNNEREALAAIPTGSPRPTMTSVPVTPTPTATPVVTPAAAPVSVAPKPAPAPAPKPAPKAAPKTSAPAAPTLSAALAELGEKVGVRYTTSPLNVRRGPGTSYDVLTSLAEGSKLTITDHTFEGWHQVNLGGKPGWVKASYLTDDAPAPAPARKPATTKATTPASPKSDDDTDSGSGSSAGDTSSCSKVAGIEAGLTSRAVKVARAVCNAFPSVSSYGGRRPGDSGYHGSGQAIDIMVSGSYGWQIAKWARANAGSLGIIEVIYEQQIWTSQRSGDGWRGMSDRGDATANHYDHVHISVG